MRSPFLLENTRVVLVHPFFPENIGAAARAMKNAGLQRLILADPGPCLPDHPNARKLAVMAEGILDRSEIAPTLSAAIDGCSLVFGTTRHVYEGMIAISPREAALLARRHAKGKGEIAIVFGNEKNGLTKADLRRCHQMIRIPSAYEETSLNLAQALMIIVYEWLVAAQDDEASQGIPLTSLSLDTEIGAIATQLANQLQAHGFFKIHNRLEKEAILRRVLSRALVTEEEASVFRGMAHRLGRLLDSLPPA